MTLVEKIQDVANDAVMPSRKDSFPRTFGFIQGSLTAIVREEVDSATADAIGNLFEIAWEAFKNEHYKS